MKKLLSCMAVVLTAAFVLAGCGSLSNQGTEVPEPDTDDTSGTGAAAVSVDSLETIGDIIELDPEELQSAVYDENVVYAFKLDDIYYRAIATISKEDAEAYININFDDEDFEEQQKEIVAPLKIDKMENLSDQILSQEELDAFVGKTGKEMVEEGWSYQGSYMLDEMSFDMDNGPFTYAVVFDGKIDEKDYEDYDAESGTADMKVKSVTFSSIGDATTIE